MDFVTREDRDAHYRDVPTGVDPMQLMERVVDLDELIREGYQREAALLGRVDVLLERVAKLERALEKIDRDVVFADSPQYIRKIAQEALSD
jgi:hypothetical protein